MALASAVGIFWLGSVKKPVHAQVDPRATTEAAAAAAGAHIGSTEPKTAGRTEIIHGKENLMRANLPIGTRPWPLNRTAIGSRGLQLRLANFRPTRNLSFGCGCRACLGRHGPFVRV